MPYPLTLKGPVRTEEYLEQHVRRYIRVQPTGGLFEHGTVGVWWQRKYLWFPYNSYLHLTKIINDLQVAWKCGPVYQLSGTGFRLAEPG